MNSVLQKKWSEYCDTELTALTPLLKRHGFTLESLQPHIQGERYLQQAVTTASGKKLILYGTDQAGTKVVIKATRDTGGKTELLHERKCRLLLQKINFAAEIFHTPAEVLWIEEDNFIVSISTFIPQEKMFIERPFTEQFFLALNAFKAQEGAHATTHKHRDLIKHVYQIRDAKEYLKNFTHFIDQTSHTLPESSQIPALLHNALEKLAANTICIDQYCGFLTHTDFVPHNIRIHDETIYFLDLSSLSFGNKYEGWARFLNFMALYNPPLTEALTWYVKHNRTPEESKSLHLMRVYRLGEIIYYYTKTLPQSSGDLLKLNQLRINFWGTILEHELKNETPPAEVIAEYQQTRDNLRSSDEKERQIGLH